VDLDQRARVPDASHAGGLTEEGKIKVSGRWPTWEQKSQNNTDVGNKEDPFSDNEMDFSCLDDDENQFDVEKEQPKEKVSQTKTSAEKTTQVKEAEKVSPKKETTGSPKENEPEDMSKLLNNWESICQMDDDFEKSVITTEQESPISSEKQLRFWYWEAWEDPIKLPGEVFLFGRTADGKSVCLRVQNINRVLYLLPRQFVSSILFLKFSNLIIPKKNKVL